MIGADALIVSTCSSCDSGIKAEAYYLDGKYWPKAGLSLDWDWLAARESGIPCCPCCTCSTVLPRLLFLPDYVQQLQQLLPPTKCARPPFCRLLDHVLHSAHVSGDILRCVCLTSGLWGAAGHILSGLEGRIKWQDAGPIRRGPRGVHRGSVQALGLSSAGMCHGLWRADQCGLGVLSPLKGLLAATAAGERPAFFCRVCSSRFLGDLWMHDLRGPP